MVSELANDMAPQHHRTAAPDATWRTTSGSRENGAARAERRSALNPHREAERSTPARQAHRADRSAARGAARGRSWAGCPRHVAVSRVPVDECGARHRVHHVVVRDPLAVADIEGRACAGRGLHLERRGCHAIDVVGEDASSSGRRRQHAVRGHLDRQRRAAEPPPDPRVRREEASRVAAAARPIPVRLALLERELHAPVGEELSGDPTSRPESPAAVDMLSGCSAIVSGELPSQRPTLVSAGKNRPRGSRRSAHSPFAWRSWSANSVFPLARRCAATRTSTSPSAPWAAGAAASARASRSAAADASAAQRRTPLISSAPFFHRARPEESAARLRGRR